jgi:hypothetical protein
VLRAAFWRAITAGVFLAAAGTPVALGAMTLREAFELAGPAHGYDKYIELETGRTYAGGLLIGPIFSPLSWTLEGEAGLDVFIAGNGAVLDLQGEQLCISYCDNRLAIEDCVILNGNIRYRGMNSSLYHVVPTGSVRQVTFYAPQDYGIRLQGAGDGITLERNLVINAVDTGWDYLYTNGIASDWLPTGTNISFSIQMGFYGTPEILENWTFHTDPSRNADSLAHYSMLCEHG